MSGAIRDVVKLTFVFFGFGHKRRRLRCLRCPWAPTELYWAPTAKTVGTHSHNLQLLINVGLSQYCSRFLKMYYSAPLLYRLQSVSPTLLQPTQRKSCPTSCTIFKCKYF